MKLRIFLLLNIILFMQNGIKAQYNIDWIRPCGLDAKQSVMSVVDSDNNIVVTGYLQSNQIFTRKYDITGTFLWETSDSSGINSKYEKSNWINCDANNNIFVVGNRYSIGSSYDYPDAIVALKYNSSGTLLWKTIIPITVLINSQISFDCRSVLDQNGNLYIGAVPSNGAVLYKLDNNGNLLYSNFSTINSPIILNSMKIRNNKIAFAASSSQLNVAPVFVWDTSGVLLWTSNTIATIASDVEFDAFGNVVVLGSKMNQITPITIDSDVKLSKFSPTGSLLWAYYYNFGGHNFSTKLICHNNRISATGYGNNSGINWVTFQTDSAGTLLWSAVYDSTSYNDEYPYNIMATATGEILVTGVGGPSVDPLNPSFIQMPIIEYDNTGNMIWSDFPNIYGGTGLATMLAGDGSLFAISSRNMTVYHYNTAPLSIHQSYSEKIAVSAVPNPFSGSTAILFSLDENQNGSYTLYDLSGRVIIDSPEIRFISGENKINIDLHYVKKGVYFLTLKSTKWIKTIKLINN